VNQSVLAKESIRILGKRREEKRREEKRREEKRGNEIFLALLEILLYGDAY
jgi:hypothetical protein